MKREYPNQNHPLFNSATSSFSLSGPGSAAASSSANLTQDLTGKSKMFDEFNEQDAGVDELLAVLGYKVKPSDMISVAHKIEHLEGVIENNDDLSQIVSDSVHYNPSDLSSWLESMITEINPNCQQPDVDASLLNDLQAIPGNAIYPPESKKQKTSDSVSASSSIQNNQNSIVVVDSQENGIRLVHTLMACAEAVQNNDLKLGETLVKQAGILAVSQAGAMRKVAAYFAEALARRIYKLNQPEQNSAALQNLLESHFYETCPYIKFAHFTANQAILEAFAGKNKVHVIDFSMKQGMQWPALMQALALRSGGPPSFRLTGIGPRMLDHETETDCLQEVGWKLAQLADTIHVEFEYRGFVVESLSDLEASVLDIRDDEVVAVNSVFELHQLLARSGDLEKVLSTVKEMKPEIFTVVEQEANHNGSVFLERFTESLHYYSTLFDSLESSGNGGHGGGVVVDGGAIAPASDQDKVMSEVYLGKQICNVVACEGLDRVERHQTLGQWKSWFDSAGFESVHLGSNAYKQASMLLALFAGGDGYRVEEHDGCLMLGWHTRPLIATSAWKLR